MGLFEIFKVNFLIKQTRVKIAIIILSEKPTFPFDFGVCFKAQICIISLFTNFMIMRVFKKGHFLNKPVL